MKKIIIGFSLLEVLCALVLSSLLMVAVLGVVGGLAKAEKTLVRHQTSPAWHRRLASRLEQDLKVADKMERLQNGFQLHGLLASDPTTGSLTWQMATVEYVVEPSPLGAVLLRREVADVAANEPCYVVLAHQVTLLALVSPGESIPDRSSSDELVMMTIADGPPPATLRLVLRTSPTAIPCDHLLVTL